MKKNVALGEDYIFVAKENAFGTYIHGIFDNEEFTRRFLNNVRMKKGLEPLEEDFSFAKFKEEQYDKLANLIRDNLDIEEIYKIMK